MQRYDSSLCSSLAAHEGEKYGQGRDRVTLYDQTVYVLSMEQLRKRLENMTADDYYPLVERQGSVGTLLEHTVLL